MYKIDVDRLLKDELEYELKVRGVDASGTVDELRKEFRGLLALERDGSFVQGTLVLDAEAELKTCEEKLNDVEALIESYQGTGSQMRKITTKIAHLVSRLNRVKSPEGVVDKRATLLKRVAFLTAEFNGKAKDRPLENEEDHAPLDPTFHAMSASTPLNTTREPVGLDDPGTSSSGTSGIGPSVPVYKWGLKFSGRSDMSVNAFLVKVDEYCTSRNVNRSQLFASASDLFEGDALMWYRVVKNHVSNWDNLVRHLKEEFLPPHTGDLLWRQILTRTQGKDESIGIYVAIMTSLFDRMPTNVSDTLRMKVLRTNILPFYQERLSLLEIGTPFELIEYYRKLESTRVNMESFKPPQTSPLSLEPDLAYVPPKSSRAAFNVVESQNVCYRCNKPGHFARECQNGGPRTPMKCFRCGKEGFTVRTCPNCKRAGNGSVRH